MIAVGAGDFGDEGVSTQEAEFAADPGGAAAELLMVTRGLGKEDGAEMTRLFTMRWNTDPARP